MNQKLLDLLSRNSLIFVISLSFALLSMSATQAAESELRISPQALQKQLDQFVILDARPASDYLVSHIPGALNFPVADTYAHKATNGKIIEPQAMQAKLRSLGISVNQPVVVYDQGQLLDAARLFWALEVYGLNQVKLLNQGFAGWQKAQLATDATLPKVTPSDYVTNIQSNRLATRFTTLLASKNPNQIIIDARPEDAYLGKVSSAKRYGHILSAINIPASHNLTQDNDLSNLQSLAELKSLYQAIPHTSKVIIYCAIGRISSTNYLALRELGYDVANYDASWNEWGNDDLLPITSYANLAP
ncbi:sulfurtransferase [Thiosulfativibrio zosterae]|uniref:Sulfurtransferase n=1 Tax=Thiosulfativibrio zosterae TaxID=2675053 RepID=A0A6F8PQV4_9GAMM|nr:sulfurtransferase [Thiosulfativibrio zosterae]BBP44466.1 sulfurtransferase [Thiosulfativibrio zosterae]